MPLAVRIGQDATFSILIASLLAPLPVKDRPGQNRDAAGRVVDQAFLCSQEMIINGYYHRVVQLFAVLRLTLLEEVRKRIVVEQLFRLDDPDLRRNRLRAR